MKRGIITGGLVLALWWSGANFASAQVFAPVIGGGSPFFGLGLGNTRTHPYGPIQMAPLNPQIADLQQTLSRLNPDGSLRSNLDPTGTASQTGLVTGHAATFFNTGRYYPDTFLPPGSGTPSAAGFGNGTTLGAGIGGYNSGLGAGGLIGGGLIGGGFGAERSFGGFGGFR